MAKVECPNCMEEYELKGIIPPDARGATMRCNECGYEFDLAPNKVLGWNVPTTRLRPEQRAK